MRTISIMLTAMLFLAIFYSPYMAFMQNTSINEPMEAKVLATMLANHTLGLPVNGGKTSYLYWRGTGKSVYIKRGLEEVPGTPVLTEIFKATLKAPFLVKPGVLTGQEPTAGPVVPEDGVPEAYNPVLYGVPGYVKLTGPTGNDGMEVEIQWYITRNLEFLGASGVIKFRGREMPFNVSTYDDLNGELAWYRDGYAGMDVEYRFRVLPIEAHVNVLAPGGASVEAGNLALDAHVGDSGRIHMKWYVPNPDPNDPTLGYLGGSGFVEDPVLDVYLYVYNPSGDGFLMAARGLARNSTGHAGVPSEEYRFEFDWFGPGAGDRVYEYPYDNGLHDLPAFYAYFISEWYRLGRESSDGTVYTIDPIRDRIYSVPRPVAGDYVPGTRLLTAYDPSAQTMYVYTVPEVSLSMPRFEDEPFRVSHRFVSGIGTLNVTEAEVGKVQLPLGNVTEMWFPDRSTLVTYDGSTLKVYPLSEPLSPLNAVEVLNASIAGGLGGYMVARYDLPGIAAVVKHGGKLVLFARSGDVYVLDPDEPSLDKVASLGEEVIDAAYDPALGYAVLHPGKLTIYTENFEAVDSKDIDPDYTWVLAGGGLAILAGPGTARLEAYMLLPKVLLDESQPVEVAVKYTLEAPAQATTTTTTRQEETTTTGTETATATGTTTRPTATRTAPTSTAPPGEGGGGPPIAAVAVLAIIVAAAVALVIVARHR